MRASPEVTFVIPVKNEERFLPATLDSIREHGSAAAPFEVVVVDHESTDGSVEAARRHEARVVGMPGGTIGAARNRGVAEARGRLLVFLDADVTLTEEWARSFPEVRHRLRHDPEQVTGSRCLPPLSSGWIGRVWHGAVPEAGAVSHIGTGHLITSRELFDRLEGFSTVLRTGEDYDFCQRARGLGARIVSEPRLRAIHHGTPATLSAFFRRELWHGTGDWQPFRRALRSKVVAAASAFLVLHVALGVTLVAGAAARAWAPLCATGILALCLASALLRNRTRSLNDLLLGTILYYVYYWGRILSPFLAAGTRSTRAGR